MDNDIPESEDVVFSTPSYLQSYITTTIRKSGHPVAATIHLVLAVGIAPLSDG